MSHKICKHNVRADECSQCFNERQIPVDAYLNAHRQFMSKLPPCDHDECGVVKCKRTSLHEEIITEYAFNGGKGEDLIYADDMPEIITKVRENDKYEHAAKAIKIKDDEHAKTIEAVLKAVEAYCEKYMDNHERANHFDGLRLTIKGVSDELT